MDTTNKPANTTGQRPFSVSCLALFQALRPQQWIKNALIFLPFLFAVNAPVADGSLAWSLDDLGAVPGLLRQLLLVAIAFCAMSSATYLLNDLMDREDDRKHPAKRSRPIAASLVGVPAAVAAMSVLALGGVAVMALVNPALAAASFIYLGVNVAYSFGLKRVVVLDLMAVANGYVIRIAAGALAIDVFPSPWLFVTTGAGALFIVLGRRYAEVRLAGDLAPEQRSVLSKYHGPFVGQLLTMSAVAAWLSYTLYTVEAPHLPDNDAMLLTVPIVTFGLFRYLYLLNSSPRAEAPEQLIIRDLPLLASVVCWVGVSALVLLLNG